MIMTRFSKSLRIGLLAGLLVPAAAFAQPPSSAEQAYVRQAMGINQTELALGRLALERGSSEDVKQMATKMVERHSALQSQLGDIARKSGIDPSPETTAAEQATQNRLEKLSGADFDAAFRQAVEDIHQQEMTLHKGELANGSDSALQGYAQSRVTALEKAAAQAKAPATQNKPKRDW
jgi:putative membrane protein